MSGGPGGPYPPGDEPEHEDDGEPRPAAEAADPVNPDIPPGSPSGDDLYDAMLDENREATGDDRS